MYFINHADIDVHEFWSESINAPYITTLLRRIEFSFVIGLDLKFFKDDFFCLWLVIRIFMKTLL